jgi:hypothetical protein
MKQKDIVLIAVAALAAGILSLVVARMLFMSDKQRQERVELVDPISTDFKVPDAKYFNKDSINPTKLIQIAENANQTPFNATPKQ